ncbi:Alpha/beta hydrolase fold-1 [Fusarium oxysporum f. sp. vasinfectum]|nr:Alpha/beta hydrolase fold-1 [Fusarium oxysporum f. sp. vasinfectum]KAK2934768.1 Alpha/beta hydrolase fold-1 [Fusarium oxysporum f. sp. vasinfectum]
MSGKYTHESGRGSRLTRYPKWNTTDHHRIARGAANTLRYRRQLGRHDGAGVGIAWQAFRTIYGSRRDRSQPDSKFRGGRYGGDPPRDGLAAARMAAMISYRTHSSFEKRFGRRQLETCTTPNRMLSKVSGTRNGTRAPFAVDVQRAERDDGHYDNSGIFLAQSYLRYQGEKFNARFDANCYLHILDKIDSHDIARVRYPSLSDDEAILSDLSQIRKPTLVVGVPTDGLYPPSEQIFLSQGLKNATFAMLQSDGGHDAFLIQGDQLNELLRSFFDSDPDL